MMLVALLSLAIGFLLGVVFTVYRSGSSAPVAVTQTPGQPPQTSQGMPDRSAEIAALEDETVKNPGSASAWTSLGNIYFDTAQHAKAIRAYEKALEIFPNNPDVWTDLGVMYRRNQQPEKAVAAFDKAIELSPKHEISRFNKGIVLLHDLEDMQGAIASWELLLSVNPNAKAPNGQPVSEMIKQFKAAQ
ncbi:MAG: tetratricopeptide repeat protein [Desulfobacteraceae bacterium]|nr:tetratricopeptide repeat protein [Desulfobacteraceae bacterium]